MNKLTTLAIINALGTKAIQARLRVTHHAVRRARSEGTMPGHWYGPILEMCEAAGVDCPVHVFNWKVPLADAPAAAE